jgi:hypothetical protein
VFAKGLLDTLDDISWSSKKQSQIIRQDSKISDEEWIKCRQLIIAEHRITGFLPPRTAQ